MEVTDSTHEFKSKAAEKEQSTSERESGQVEHFDTVPEMEDSVSNPPDRLSSLHESLIERNYSSMDQEKNIHKVYSDDQDEELAESSSKNIRKCSAMHEENTSLDEVSPKISKHYSLCY